MIAEYAALNVKYIDLNNQNLLLNNQIIILNNQNLLLNKQLADQTILLQIKNLYDFDAIIDASLHVTIDMEGINKILAKLNLI